MKKYAGREWKWWVRRNAHFCHFCMIKDGGKELERIHQNESHEGRLGLQCLHKRDGKGQYTKGYWHNLYYIWLEHMKKYHPEVLQGDKGGEHA